MPMETLAHKGQVVPLLEIPQNPERLLLDAKEMESMSHFPLDHSNTFGDAIAGLLLFLGGVYLGRNSSSFVGLINAVCASVKTAVGIMPVFAFGCLGCSDHHDSKATHPRRASDLDVRPTPVPKNDCPWSFSESPVVAGYRNIGIELQLDCTPIDLPTVLYGQGDVDAALQALDKSRPVVQGLTSKPSIIRLGQRYLHDPKTNLLQIAVAREYLFDLSRYIDVTMQLMHMERSEFNSRIRFSYGKITKVRWDSGESRDIGSQENWVPEQKVVDKDLASIRTFREQILSHATRFPDVLIYHGNDFFSFELDDWNQCYSFSGADEDQSRGFFEYLGNLEKVALTYAPTKIDVDIFRGLSLKPDFSKTEYLFEVAGQIRDMVQSKPIRTVSIVGPVNFDGASAPLSVKFENGSLKLFNVCGASCDTLDRDITLVKKCLAAQDFSKSFSEKCTSLDD